MDLSFLKNLVLAGIGLDVSMKCLDMELLQEIDGKYKELTVFLLRFTIQPNASMVCSFAIVVIGDNV